MSDYDYNNLPSGVSPTDAQNMGITSYDDSQIAFSKWANHHTNEMVSQEINRQSNNSSQSTSYSSSQPTSSSISSDSIHLIAGYFNTRHFASVVEGYRRKLAQERNEKTGRLKLISKRLLVIALTMFIFNKINLIFNVSSLYFLLNILHDTTIIFVLTILGVYFAWKYMKENGKILTDEEKQWNSIGNSMLKALDSVYKFEKKKDPINGYYNLMEKRFIPVMYFHPDLIHKFNINYKSITGEKLPYLVRQIQNGVHKGTIGLIERELRNG